MTVRERVANGVALLDEHCPGWDKHINTRTLNISSPSDCVCSQLEQAGRMDEQWGLFGEVKIAKNAGILAIGSYSDYDDLTVEWKRVIRERQRKVVFA